jgi:hypothetical protein
MAKKQLSLYKFYPGIIPPAYNQYPNAVSLLTSNKTFLIKEIAAYIALAAATPASPPTAYPNAIALLTSNKTFIKEEANAWINAQIASATLGQTFYQYNYTPTVAAKCKRDIGYLVDAWIADVTGGGNAETIRISCQYQLNGVAQLLNPVQEAAVYSFIKTLVTTNVLTKTLASTYQSPVVALQNTTGTAGEAAAITRVSTLIDNTISFISTPTLAAAISVSANYNATFVGYTYDAAKCERDAEYVVDSYIYDLTYGGNSLTNYVASRYYINGVIQINLPAVEVAGHTFLKTLITSYILTNTYFARYQLTYQQQVLSNSGEAAASTTVTTLANTVINAINTGLSTIPTTVLPDSQNGGLLPNTIGLLEANKRFIQEEAIYFIQYNIDNNIPPFTYYTYNASKCRRDVSYVLEGYITDLKHGGNRQTVFNASKYFENGVAQVDGDRQPEIAAHTFIRDLIDNYILANVSFSARQSAVAQVKLLGAPPETVAQTRIKELSNTILDVIQYGLSYLPVVASNRGYIKLPGFFKLKDILLITNASRNIIMYNFADPSLAAEITYTEFADSDFPAYNYGNDKLTTITFDVDTTNMMVTDNIQIFVEGKEQEVRLNRSGTDAMERMKVGIPQSMLDADFEYGLQPTKWQAISLMRNYPSIYEIPGSDIAVVSVVTDASSANGGSGASLITVTTLSSHGLTAGNPITIKALANSVTGFSRAEGSFLIFAVTGATTFTYYAKSKVGTVNGTTLSSTYTQLRRAGYYTGASIGSSTFNIYSAGSSGTITTALNTPSGRDVIGFSGTVPPVGAPISGTGIASGSQITAVTGAGGIAATTTLTVTNAIGATSLIVNNTAGISAGLLVDMGAGSSGTVTDVTGNVVTIGSPMVSQYTGSTQSYTNISVGAKIKSAPVGFTGTPAVFTISRNGTSYTTTVTDPGDGYTAGMTTVVYGGYLDGLNTTNDATITVLTASPRYTVSILNNASLVGGNGYSDATNVTTLVSPPGGTGLTVDIVTDGLGLITSVTINQPGSGYVNGGTVSISGGNGNANIGILYVSPGGLIQTVSTSGTAVTATPINFYSSFTISDVTTALIASGNTGITYSAIATVEATFGSAHGFVPGDTITVAISSTDTGAQLAGGPFFVEQVPTATSLRYTARAAGTIANTLIGSIYARPDCFFVHRPFDGGVQLGTGSSSHGASAIRMSKKYIRYQSGKGVMYNTGALFAPSYDLRSLTASGTSVGSTITVTTDDTDHGCQVGATIVITGVTTAGYNATYTIVDIADERTFSVLAQTTLGNTTAILGSPCQMSVKNWHGATVRSGIFDDQNGMFWQYDGIKMAVGRRSSTFQVAGTISIPANSNLVTGSNTRFSQQLAQGDRVVIRGMSHVVSQIISDTSMTVTPDFRGVADVTNVKICKTIDFIIPQEYWNIDPLNGSGPSGYNLDPTKMQMIGIQHTWYGAGFIDFMLRGPDGNYTWAHRFRNSNVNTEAYMRTGNQPVRYEVINEGARGRLASGIDNVQTTIPMSADDAYWFPNAGTVMVDNELIRYTGNSGTALTGCVRASPLTQFTAGSQRNFTGAAASSHVSGAGVILVSNTITPNISHWGSAFMIDGQFDSDRGYIFNYSATGLTATVDKSTAFLIRLAPSVSNALVGDLGEKELLNRAQLLLNAISITSDPVTSVDPFTGNTWSSGGTATSGLYYSNVSAGVKNWYQATSTGTFSATAPTFTSGTGASGTYGVNLTWAGATPNNAGAIVVEGVLNPSNYPTDPTNITWTGLSNAAAGGQPSFAQIASGGSVTWSGNVSTSTATVAPAFQANLTAKSFAAVTNTLTATSFATISRTASAASFASATSVVYNSAFSTGRNDFLITTTAFDAFTTPVAVGDPIQAGIYVNGGQTVLSWTRNYINLNSTAYTRIIMSGNANSTSPSAVTNGQQDILTTINSSVSAIYASAISAARTDFLVPNSQAASVAITDVLSGTNVTGGQTISSITTNYTTISGVVYARIIMSSAGNGTSTVGAGNNVSLTATSAATSLYGRAFSTGRVDFLITNTEYDVSGILPGDGLAVATYLTSSQTISSVTRAYITIGGTSYTRIVMSAAPNANSTTGVGNDISTTVIVAGSAATYQNKNYLFFTSSSWLASGAAIGTKVASDQTQFPAGTSVAGISTRTYIGNTVYRITFNQTANTTIAAAATLKFQFGAQYALPGEQVFSFISNPGETGMLDLGELKELTATALGGRGTFPNGPDVLAINVYKVAGSSTGTNLILRWGEAQA